MTIFIDRRLNPGDKNLTNRQRFLKKIRNEVLKSINESLDSKNIKDLGKNEKVKVRHRDIEEPLLILDKTTGKRYDVYSGNKEFLEGDKIPKNKQGGEGRGKEGSNAGEGGNSEDSFEFFLSQEEFLDIFFDDLELPDIVKKSLKDTVLEKYMRAGFTDRGSRSNLDIKRSYKKSLSRRIALNRPKNSYVEELENKLKELRENNGDEYLIKKLTEELLELKKKLKRIPFFDDIDLRYRRYEKRVTPSTAAVMFCIMDVSGSMDETRKKWAKIFFTLLYMFLKKKYKKIDIVFIRHTDKAKEVSEREFFYSTESGGTVVSTALELAKEIIIERYPQSEWNIYIGQASDGDNFPSDNQKTIVLLNELLNIVQYYAYVQIQPQSSAAMDLFYGLSTSNPDNLWNVYTEVAKQNKKLNCKYVSDKRQIWSVFRQLFEKRQTKEIK